MTHVTHPIRVVHIEPKRVDFAVRQYCPSDWTYLARSWIRARLNLYLDASAVVRNPRTFTSQHCTDDGRITLLGRSYAALAASCACRWILGDG